MSFYDKFQSRVLVSALILCVSGICDPSIATSPQKSDTLVFDGVKCALYEFPLAGPMEKSGYRPKIVSTGNWRGYWAEWELKNNKLYLLKIHTDDEESIIHVRDIAPEATGVMGRFQADWYTGTISIPFGYTPETDTFDVAMIFCIRKGAVVSALVKLNVKQFELMTSPKKK